MSGQGSKREDRVQGMPATILTDATGPAWEGGAMGGQGRKSEDGVQGGSTVWKSRGAGGVRTRLQQRGARGRMGAKAAQRARAAGAAANAPRAGGRTWMPSSYTRSSVTRPSRLPTKMVSVGALSAVAMAATGRAVSGALLSAPPLRTRGGAASDATGPVSRPDAFDGVQHL